MSKEVKQLAKAAKARKPDWYVMDGHDWFLPSETMEFMASVTPDFVIALLAERDALRSALERFYSANQTRLKLLSREVYLDMQRLPGMRDALYEMDDAQHQAYAALQGAQP